jgi:hypothetical protein
MASIEAASKGVSFDRVKGDKAAHEKKNGGNMRSSSKVSPGTEVLGEINNRAAEPRDIKPSPRINFACPAVADLKEKADLRPLFWKPFPKLTKF